MQKVHEYDKAYAYIRKAVIKANRVGRVTVDAQGIENIPQDESFIFYPNHQGMFDALALWECCERPFAFVSKKEVVNLILLKQIIKAVGSLAIDREDVRQSMTVIKEITEQVKSGRNFMIFAEGTRSREGNKVQEFKGGSFKAAQKAKCPIVPVALIDCFKPFDESSIRKITVKVRILPPLRYEDYKDMKTVEIAEYVKNAISNTIEAETKPVEE